MYVSPWQLAKLAAWLQEQLIRDIPVVCLCDLFFWFENRRGFLVFLGWALAAEALCLLYLFFRCRCRQCKKRIPSSQILTMKTFRCPHCGCDRF